MTGIALNVLVSGLPYVPAVLGIYLIFRARPDYDLTLNGSFVTGAAVAGVLLSARQPVELAVTAGVAVGCLLGVMSAGLHIALRTPVILVGLFMTLGLYSIDLMIMNGPTISLVNVPSLFSGYAGLSGAQQDLVTSLIVAAVDLAVLGAVGLLLASEVGLALRLSGLNKIVPVTLGISENRMLIANLALANGLAALSGTLVSQSQGFVVAESGSDVLLAGLGSVLLGEALLHWWRSSSAWRGILHVAVGTLAYWTIIVIVLYVGMPPGDLQGVTALIFVTTLAIGRGLSRLGRRRSTRPRALAPDTARDGKEIKATRHAGDLTIADVTVIYDRGRDLQETALRTFSLAVPKGQVAVVVGHNGAGKSSLLRAIAGTVRLQHGRIRIGDTELSQLGRAALTQLIGVVSDHPEHNTVAELTVAEHLSLALTRGDRRLRPALGRSRRKDISALASTAQLGLEQRLEAPVGTLSAGQRQATALIMALAAGPALLLLDEYTTHLDPQAAERLRTVTRRLGRESGSTILFITHDIDEAMEMADRIVVISRGTLIADFDLTKTAVTREIIEQAAGYARSPATTAGDSDSGYR